MVVCREGLQKGLSVMEARKIVADTKGIPLETVVDASETTEETIARSFALLKHMVNKLGDSQEAAVNNSSSLGGFDSIKILSGHRVLAVSHGAFIKAFLIQTCGLTQCSERILNGSVTALRVKVINAENDHYEFNVHDVLYNFRAC
jgi:broad specificity phosphatase PhoE